MSQKIDPRDVLTYLNELGYTNINAQQLKDFITDLKKLIKYESRRRQKENVETITPINLNDANRCHCPYVQTCINQKQESITVTNDTKVKERPCCDHPLCQRNQINVEGGVTELADIFNHLYNQHTVASRAKESTRKNKCISVHIKKSKTKPNIDKHWIHSENKAEEDNEREGEIQLIQNIETVSDGSKLYVNTESTIRSTDPSSKANISRKLSPSKRKSKCSFIRTSSAKSINKSDPVALYHYYQDQWKKQKFPGQENHSDLRWSVREKMLSGPKVEMHPTASCRKRSNSWRG